MKVFLTGATGYLGSMVARRLASSGHEVVALCRSGREGAVPPGCRAVQGDLLDPPSLKRAITGCEAVMHMGALVRMWMRDRREFDRVNVEGFAAVLRAAEEAGVGRIVYTSTIVALGPTDGSVGDESFERQRFAFCTDYERTKWIAEKLARQKLAAGFPMIVVYPGVVYGAGPTTEGNLLLKMFTDHLAGRLRARIGRGDLRICYAFNEDVAEGHCLALERGQAGRGYVLGGENATLNEVFGILTELTGEPPPRYVIPYWAGETIGMSLQVLARLFGFRPAVTAGVVRTFRHEWAYCSDRAIRELGYEITPLREGLRMTLDALRGGGGEAAPAS